MNKSTTSWCKYFQCITAFLYRVIKYLWFMSHFCRNNFSNPKWSSKRIMQLWGLSSRNLTIWQLDTFHTDAVLFENCCFFTCFRLLFIWNDGRASNLVIDNRLFTIIFCKFRLIFGMLWFLKCLFLSGLCSKQWQRHCRISQVNLSHEGALHPGYSMDLA